jgi:hypothetical protein
MKTNKPTADSLLGRFYGNDEMRDFLAEVMGYEKFTYFPSYGEATYLWHDGNYAHPSDWWDPVGNMNDAIRAAEKVFGERCTIKMSVENVSFGYVTEIESGPGEKEHAFSRGVSANRARSICDAVITHISHKKLKSPKSELSSKTK